MEQNNTQHDNPLLPNHSDVIEDLLESRFSRHRVVNESNMQQTNDEISDTETLKNAKDSYCAESGSEGGVEEKSD